MNAVTRLPQWVANCQLLTIDVVIVKVFDVWTQFQARISTRQYKRRNSRHQGDFFIVAAFQHPQFMTGWKGYFRVGRFTFCAGSANPSSLSPIRISTRCDRFHLQKEPVL